jgi:hypothetical protein
MPEDIAAAAAEAEAAQIPVHTANTADVVLLQPLLLAHMPSRLLTLLTLLPVTSLPLSVAAAAAAAAAAAEGLLRRGLPLLTCMRGSTSHAEGRQEHTGKQGKTCSSGAMHSCMVLTVVLQPSCCKI